jgi:hypothetical protein
MLKATVICLVFSLFSLIAHAEIPDEFNSIYDDTRYDSLKKVFTEQAITPKPENSKGWWSGRCYHPENPNLAIPSLLTITPIRTDIDGPLFKTKYKLILIYIYDSNVDPAYFDKMSPGDREFTTNVIRNSKPSFILEIINDSLSSYWLGNERRDARIYYVKKSQNYFVGKHQKLINGDETAEYCYWYLKVN